MNKKMNKKGFTIVELVIVIAVIAILAAVLIPTFVSLTRKANIANDTAVVKNLNTAAISAQAKTFDEALVAAKESGYLVANLNSKADKCYFVWEDDTDQFLLYDLKEKAIIYSNTEVTGDPDDSWYFAINNPKDEKEVKDVWSNVTIKQLVSNLADLKSWVAKEGDQTIYVDESMDMKSQGQIVIGEGSNITLKIVDSVVTGNRNGSYSLDNVPFVVDGGTLTIEGGTIGATGSYLDADGDPVQSAVLASNGTFNLSNTTVETAGKNIVIGYTGAAGTVSNTTINANSSAINIGHGSDVIVENCTINVDNEAIWVTTKFDEEGQSSSATIKGGTYSGVGNVIALHGGEVVIEDGVFNATKANMFRFWATGSSITIKGGTFTTANGTYTFDKLTVDVLKGMMSGSSVGTVAVVQNADGSFTISN
jgi:prepilin-type N-terminal cleavage/methylation domain-containing protein